MTRITLINAFQLRHLRVVWAALAPFHHLIHRRSGAGENRFDSAAAAIADKTGQAQALGLAFCPGAEKNALHPAMDCHMNRFFCAIRQCKLSQLRVVPQRSKAAMTLLRTILPWRVARNRAFSASVWISPASVSMSRAS